jgi:V/A-type H+-transporting ATPase subunit E
MNKTNSNIIQANDSHEGKTALIQGIENDAKREAREIIEQAEESKKVRLEAADKQVTAILEEAKAKALEQVYAIKKNKASLISVDTKRQMLKLRENSMDRIMELVKKKMEAHVTSPEYSTLLKEWIVEAVIGLMAPAASVNASAQEKKLVTYKILIEAEEEVERLTGRKVLLNLSEFPPLLDQGIIVTSADGKTAFNNQVRTKLARSYSEIRKLIYTELFGE